MGRLRGWRRRFWPALNLPRPLSEGHHALRETVVGDAGDVDEPTAPPRGDLTGNFGGVEILRLRHDGDQLVPLALELLTVDERVRRRLPTR